MIIKINKNNIKSKFINSCIINGNWLEVLYSENLKLLNIQINYHKNGLLWEIIKYNSENDNQYCCTSYDNDGHIDKIEYIKNDYLHNENGRPARIIYDKNKIICKEYFINGIECSYEY